MLDGENQQKLRNVLQELGTEESWYATSVCEREYNEGAFLRMCQAVALSNAYDPALDLGLPPVLGWAKNVKALGRKELQRSKTSCVTSAGLRSENSAKCKGTHCSYNDATKKSRAVARVQR